MKILNCRQIKSADEFTIQHEPILSIDLMERASHKMVETFTNDYQSTSWVKHIFCGNGNNGGDGLAIARMLQQDGHPVKVYLFHGERSADNQTNLERLIHTGAVEIDYISEVCQLPTFQHSDVVIDAMYGYGLNKPLIGLQADVVKYLNQSSAIRISIDTPSGLFCDQHSEGVIFEADRVYTFQFPKLAFLLPENGKFVKRFKILDIRLSHEFVQQLPVHHFFLEKKDIQQRYQPRNKFSHKGSFGHSFIIAGSYGKMGAALLASKACLRSGAGLVTAHIPGKAYDIFQTGLPEAMCMTDTYDYFWTNQLDISGYDAVGIGPGIGTSRDTAKALKKTLQSSTKPVVLDADAINILALNDPLWSSIPQHSILTPHPGEFKRLAGEWKNDFERLELQRRISALRKVIIVLKGAHTSITDTEGNVYFNSTGNSGMSTAGSGDVLTGIITGLLSQGYSPEDAALMGVYLHGLSGNYALDDASKESLIASDIIENIGKAFKFIRI